MNTIELSIGNIIAYLALQDGRDVAYFEHSFLRNIVYYLEKNHPSVSVDCDKYSFDLFTKINKNITDWDETISISGVLNSTYSSLYKLLPDSKIGGWIDEVVDEIYKEIEEIFGD